MRIISLPLIALFALGCDTAASATPKVTAAIGVDCTVEGLVSVSPSTVSMFVGDSAQLSVRAKQPPCGTGAPPSVFWQSSNTAVATVDSIGGKVRAVAVGQATIVSLLVADPAQKGAAAITVNSR